MTTRIDGDEPDGRALADDDPLVVVLRPPSEHLAPPPGRYEAIRRRASRRRLARIVLWIDLVRIGSYMGDGLLCADRKPS
ncbi:hypothetical protein ACWDSB_31550, partial [Streptomyces sp. NPDC003514]